MTKHDLPIVPTEFARQQALPYVSIRLSPVTEAGQRCDATLYLVDPLDRYRQVRVRSEIASARLREILDEAQELARAERAEAITVDADGPSPGEPPGEDGGRSTPRR